MLGKLIKYEFKHTSKTMFLTYAVLAVCTVMGAISLRYLNNRPLDNPFFNAMSKGMLALYVVVMIAVCCVDFTYLYVHYYKTMYSAQGYLTHTLPVPSAAIFHAKMFCFFAWIVVSILISALSFLCFLWIGADMALSRIILFFTEGKLIAVFGTTIGNFICAILAQAFLGILLCFLWIAASMAIGQLFQKNRTGYTILAAACLYIASQLVNTVFLVLFVKYSPSDMLKGNIDYAVEALTSGAMAINAAFALALYGICLYINSRRLNLE